MSFAGDTKNVQKNILSIFLRRQAALVALAKNYKARAIRRFRKKQKISTFWENRTNQAFDRMFTGLIKEFGKGGFFDIGFFMAHGVDYGVYLELSNDGLNEAIKPIMNFYAPLFIADAKKLFEKG